MDKEELYDVLDLASRIAKYSNPRRRIKYDESTGTVSLFHTNSEKFIAENIQKEEDDIDIKYIDQAIKLFDYAANKIFKRLLKDGLNDVCEKHLHCVFDEKVLAYDVDAFMYRYDWYPKHKSLVVPIRRLLKRYYNNLSDLEEIISKFNRED